MTLHLDDNMDRNCYNCVHASWYPEAGACLGPQPSPPESEYVECDGGEPLGLSFLVESLDRQILMDEFSCNYWEAAALEDMDDIR